MAKVKINSLPPGFSLENGKIVKAPVEAQYGLSMDDKRNFLKSMYSDGGRTGDQVGYGLETYPTSVTSQQMAEGGQKNIRYSLTSVPREEANLEAEGGESVLTDLNDDGNFGLYHIKGPRHSSGGVPMNLPEQSFIFSDTRAMKMRGSELAEFGIESKKAMTPAKISKRFDLNKYYAAIDDDFADEMQVRSAELMLDKNKKSLSKLAYAQELSKDFEDGVPLAAHPYLVSIGQDPIEFTAKVENISEKKAIEKTMASLSPQQQQQVMMLQQFLAQAGQMQAPQQGMQQGMPSMEQGMMPPQMQQPMQQQMPPEMQGMPPMPMGKYGKELPKYQQAGSVKRQKKYGPGTHHKLDLTGLTQVGQLGQGYQAYENLERLFTSSDPQWVQTVDAAYQRYLKAAQDQGIQPLSKDDLMREFLAYQKNNYVISDLLQGQDQYGYAHQLDRSYDVNAGYKNINAQNLFNKVAELSSDYAGYQIDPEKTAHNQLFFQTIVLEDKKNQYPYLDYMATGPTQPTNWIDNEFISNVDGKYGDNSLRQFVGVAERPEEPEVPEEPQPSQPCPNAAELEAECNAKENHKWVPYNEADGTGCMCMPMPAEPGEPKEPPSPEFWKQDLIKMNAIAQRKRDLFRPFQPDVGRANVDYILEDPTRAIAAINEQANILNNANNAFSGPQVGSARNASAAGKTMKAVADATAGVQARNVATANAAEYQNANLDYRTDAERRAGAIKEYDGTVLALQNYMDEKNFDREQYADAYANALTNRANTYNLNLIQDYYTVDPFETAGMITQTGKRAFEPTQPTDRSNDVLNAITRLKREGITPSGELLRLMVPDIQGPQKTNIQNEYETLNTGYPGNQTRKQQSQRGREIRYVAPFYRGKTFF